MKESTGVSKWLIIVAVLLTVTGLVMLIWPGLTMSMLGKVLGMGMLIVGLAHIVIYFTKDHFGTVMQMDLTVGVLLAALGSFMLMHADFVSIALPFGVGIILLIGGISKIQYALDMKRIYFTRWQIMLAFAVILIVLGVIMLYNPFNDQVLVYMIGASLLLDGLLDILSVLMISHRSKQIARGRFTGPARGRTKNGDAVIEEQQMQPPVHYAGQQVQRPAGHAGEQMQPPVNYAGEQMQPPTDIVKEQPATQEDRPR